MVFCLLTIVFNSRIAFLILSVYGRPNNESQSDNFWLLFTPTIPVDAHNLLPALQTDDSPRAIAQLAIEFNLSFSIRVKGQILDACRQVFMSDSYPRNNLSLGNF